MKIIHLILGKANPERMNGVNKVVHALATQQHRAGADVAVWGITADLSDNYPAREFATRLFLAKRNPFGLAAELREASKVHRNYGIRRLDPDKDVRITLLEGGPRILGPLPEKVSNAAASLLGERHVRVVAGCRVARIEAGRVEDADGNHYPADLCVWAAGIKAPAFLAGLGTGVWGSTDDLRETWALDRRFEPGGDRAALDASYARWRDAVERSKGWASQG